MTSRVRHLAPLGDGTGRGPERGATMIEILLAGLIGAVVVAVGGGAMMAIVLSVGPASRHLSSSDGAFRSGARFADDVSSAAPVSGATAIARGAIGCGGVTSVVRFVAPSTAGVTVRSYVVASDAEGATLERQVCSGSTLAGAVAATPTTGVVVPDLATTGGATAECTKGDDDSACQAVDLKVKTRTGYEFTVSGVVQASLSPVATTAPVPQPPLHGTCTLRSAADSYVDGKNAFGSRRGDNYGTKDKMADYGEPASPEYAYIRFDLLSNCTGSGEPATLPGERTLASAKLKLVFLEDASGVLSSWGHKLEALGQGATWTESGLTYNNRPSTVQSAGRVDFQTKDGPPSVLSLDVYTAVDKWYTGEWLNNGWMISRTGAGEAFWSGFKYATKEHSNASYRPTLTLTW